MRALCRLSRGRKRQGEKTGKDVAEKKYTRKACTEDGRPIRERSSFIFRVKPDSSTVGPALLRQCHGKCTVSNRPIRIIIFMDEDKYVFR